MFKTILFQFCAKFASVGIAQNGLTTASLSVKQNLKPETTADANQPFQIKIVFIRDHFLS